MELNTYLTILIRRWRIVLLVALIVSSVFAYGSKYIPPSYQAETRLRVITPLAGSMVNASHEVYFASQLRTTYAQIATSDQIMVELKEKLNLETLPEISVKVIPESEIIQIVVVSSDRVLSAEAANSLAELIISKQDKVLDASAIPGGADITSDRQNELQAKLSEAIAEHDKIVQIYSQKTAQIETLGRKIQTNETLYHDLVTQQRQTEARDLAEKMAVLDQQYENLSTEAHVYSEQIVMLRQQIDNDQRIYSDLLYNVRQERKRDILVVSPAIVPSISSSPGRGFVVGLGIICGLIAGVIFAFVVDSLDTRIFTSEQIRQITTIPTLGQFPKFQRRKGRVVPLDFEAVTLFRDYWVICTRIQTILQSGSIKTILVTSPNPMEGKSTFISSIAIGLARNNLKVLIVDADLRRSQQQKIYEVSGGQGLSDFLEGEDVRLEEVIQKNVKPNVDLLPNLNECSDPTGMLNSSQFAVLLQKIKKYDVVLFDSPALMAVPDAFNLAKVVDGVIILAQRGRTTSGDIRSTCDYLEGIGSKLLGIVLSQVPVKKEQDHYSRRKAKGWIRFISRN